MGDQHPIIEHPVNKSDDFKSDLKQLDSIGKNSIDTRELLEEHQHHGYEGRDKIVICCHQCLQSN